MKKLLALLLALVMALSLVACGGGDSTPSGGDTDEGGAAVADNGGSTAQGNDAGDGGSYLSYGDLEYTQRFCLWGDDRVDFLCDYPSGFAFESFGAGMASDSNTAFAIVVAHGETRMRDTALEDAFLAFLNGDDGCFHSTLRQVNRATYDEVTPEIEYITLDTGREAIKFSGTQHVDDYGTIYDSVLCGYFTMLDDIPVISCYIIFDEETLEQDRIEERDRYLSPEEMDHYALEMINTLRIAED